MQVFCPDYNTFYIAEILDPRRRNKQILEICQMLSVILKIDIGWKIPKYVYSHKNTKLYNNNEGILYLTDFLFHLLHIYKYKNKKLKDHKCKEIFNKYFNKYHVLFVSFDKEWRPKHITNDFIKQHQKLLLSKNFNYYSKYFL